MKDVSTFQNPARDPAHAVADRHAARKLFAFRPRQHPGTALAGDRGEAAGPGQDTLHHRAWEHFASPHCRTTFEILLHVPPDADVAWQGQMLAAWSRLWTQWFPGGKLRGLRNLGLMQYTIAVLAGLAAMQMLSGRSMGRRASSSGRRAIGPRW